MKFLSILFAVFLLASISEGRKAHGGGPYRASDGGYRGLGFPAMQSEGLNNKLANALTGMGCTVSSHYGVAASPNKNGASCHLKGLAIDLVSLNCRNSKSNEQNLRDLAYKLGATFGTWGSLSYTICYKEIGKKFCRPGHDEHLHFGAKESRGCPP